MITKENIDAFLHHAIDCMTRDDEIPVNKDLLFEQIPCISCIAQGLAAHLEPVYAYTIFTNNDSNFGYRSQKLFPINAVRLHSVTTFEISTPFIEKHRAEVWLLETGSVIKVSCVKVCATKGDESIHCEFRTVKGDMADEDWKFFIAEDFLSSIEELTVESALANNYIFYEV